MWFSLLPEILKLGNHDENQLSQTNFPWGEIPNVYIGVFKKKNFFTKFAMIFFLILKKTSTLDDKGQSCHEFYDLLELKIPEFPVWNHTHTLL